MTLQCYFFIINIQYLTSASLLVMATPRLDNAEDVTWPAWDSVSRVLTHLQVDRSITRLNLTGGESRVLKSKTVVTEMDTEQQAHARTHAHTRVVAEKHCRQV